MKHPIRDRLVILITTLLLLALVALVVGLLAGLLPAEQWRLPDLARESLQVQLWIGAGALLVLIVAILNFAIILPARKKRDNTYTVQQAENGELKISLKAIEHLVEKCIAQHPELISVVSTISSNEDSAVVDLHVTLSTDINIPMAITALQKEIKQYVESCSGVHVDEVRVVVDSTREMPENGASPFAIPDMMQPKLPPRPLPQSDPSDMADPVQDIQPGDSTVIAPEETTVPFDFYARDEEAEKKPEEDENEMPSHAMDPDTASDAFLTETYEKEAADVEKADVWGMGDSKTDPWHSLPDEGEEDQA